MDSSVVISTCLLMLRILTNLLCFVRNELLIIEETGIVDDVERRLLATVVKNVLKNDRRKLS
jgi:hypothetical protein